MGIGMILITVAAAFVLILGGIMGWSKLLEILQRPALPLESIGNPPDLGKTLNAHGEWQLRMALILISRLASSTEVKTGLNEETAPLLGEWLTSASRQETSSSGLLSTAGVRLQRIENEDRVMRFLDDDRRTELRAWLNDFLKRKTT